MSILIKGMEMPKAPVLFCIHPDGKVFADLEGGWREYKAIPVPPHGDLVDRAELREIASSLRDEAVTDQEAYAIRKMWFRLGQMPVYIPAEEDE